MKNRFPALVFMMLAAGTTLRANDVAKPKGPEEDGTKPALTRIAGEGLMDSHTFQYLTELSDDIGARVTSSPAAEKATAWGVAKMKSIGLENIHTEKWSMWKGWTRGTAQAELLSPIHHTLTIDAMGWTGSTPAVGAEGEVVTANLFDLDEELKNTARFRGKPRPTATRRSRSVITIKLKSALSRWFQLWSWPSGPSPSPQTAQGSAEP